ncbi:glutamyl-tRNA synthetase [Babesia caballi]|uniref:glutamate--tRNA ligase n=1 Tax=Babesia caballi TaxID=5871 RepID=A0AAV4LR91_BABCB|nr:glutamyl-tRNA synthetase [Babesia caballi]
MSVCYPVALFLLINRWLLADSVVIRRLCKGAPAHASHISQPDAAFLGGSLNKPLAPITDSRSNPHVCHSSADPDEQPQYNDQADVLNDVRVRFAPSPTGELHVGNLRTFIYNYLFARKHGGALILRVDDTDEDRDVPGALDAIISDLKWLGFSWSEGPGGQDKTDGYQQSKRQDAYRDVAELLLQTKKAYRCFCTREELQNRRPPANAHNANCSYDKKCADLAEATVKSNLLSNKEYTIRLRNKVNEEDFILLRSNGTATYNFACAVDDHSHDISHVIRGVDHLDNTFKQARVLEAVGTILPTYVHCSLMRNKDLTKLAKRSDDSVTISKLREMGICTLPIVNYLALLGTKYSDNPKCLDLEQLAQLFDLQLLSRAPISFDMAKLKWLNRRYISDLPYPDFMNQLRSFLSDVKDVTASLPADVFLHVAALAPPGLKAGVDTMRDFVDLVEGGLHYKAPRFVGSGCYDYGGMFLNAESQRFLTVFIEWSQQLVTASDVGDCIYKMLADMLHSDEFAAIDGNAHLGVVRYALTGESRGPPLTLLVELWRAAERQSLADFVPLRQRILRLNTLDLSSNDPVAERLCSPGSPGPAEP